MKDLAAGYGYKGTIAGTRKTTPGKTDLDGHQPHDLILSRVSACREVWNDCWWDRSTPPRSIQHGHAQG